MRHRMRRTRMGRQPAHRKQTVKSVARDLLAHQRIRTTLTKAKEARRLAERLITIAKNDTVAARRQAFLYLNDRTLVKRLFKEVAPLFRKRASGFTRIIPLGYRRGDGAALVFLELTEQKIEEKVKKAKKEKAKKTEKAEKPERPEEKPKAEHHKAAPEVEPAKKEERAVEEVKKEKAKEEEKRIEKQKGIFKNLKGFFRRRTKM